MQLIQNLQPVLQPLFCIIFKCFVFQEVNINKLHYTGVYCSVLSLLTSFFTLLNQ